MPSPHHVGQRLRRIEDERLVRGQGRYAGDLHPPGLVHLALTRSPVPHARILQVDVREAAATPGVIAAWTSADLPETAQAMADGPPRDMQERPRPVLASTEVNYAGEAVAAVIAEHDYAAADAAELVGVELEPLPAVAGVIEAASPGAPLVHSDLESNVGRRVQLGYGDVEAAFRDGAVVARQRLSAARICGAAMETRTVTAIREGDSLTLWTSTQGVFQVRSQVAQLLGLDPEAVHVLAEDVGGGFGPKGTVYPEEVLVALAAWRLGRPVRWTAGRSEDTATTVHAHGNVMELELAADPDGRLRGLRGRMWHDAGAYASSGAGQPEIIVPHMMSAYVLPALRIDAEVLFTNSTPSGFIRGGGRPLGNFAIERMMDRLAAELRLDPAELRRRNLIQPGQMPYDTGYPEGKRTVVYDGGDYPKLLDMALDGIDYGSVRASQANGERGDGRLLGLGLACCVESSGFGRGEPARVRLEKDGRARLWIGSTPQGQGHRTIAAQMLADRLGWPLERIEVTAADTRGMPSAELTAGSRSAMHVGNATALAAAAARQRLLESAAEVLEADPADLVLEDGHVSVRGVPGRAIGVTEAIPEEGIEVLEKWDTRSSTAYSSGCHAALVAIDPETGSVELLRYAIAHDTGRPVNAMLVEGQMHGGLAHGLGYALFEEAVYLPDGTFVTPSFLDYTIASAPELASPLELMPLVTPTEANPEGIKGAGESGTIPVPAAVANAVEDAIRQADPQAAVDAIPITPLRLYQMLNRRG